MAVDDRPRGILSNSDRAYLENPKKYVESNSKQAASDRRRQIRERVKAAILDFDLLWNKWDKNEQKQVFGQFFEGQDPNLRAQGPPAIANTFALLYTETLLYNRFDELFGQGVRTAEHRLMREDSATIVEVAPRDQFVESHTRETVEEALEKLGRGQTGLLGLTDAEARSLIHLFKQPEGFEDLRDEYFEQIQASMELDW